MAIKKKIKKIIKKVQDTAAKVISTRSRLKGKRADSTRKLLKEVRASKGAPNFRNGKPTDAFKRRTVLTAEVNRLKRIAKKGKKK